MENRTLKDYAIIGLKGVAMGAADSVPGVSGGTIALIAGIYQELINTIGNIDTSIFTTWKEHGFQTMWKEMNGNFLIALIGGILLSLMTVMRLASYLLEHQPILIWSFFFGLVLASIWFVGKKVEKWNFGTVAVFIIGAAVAYFLTTLPAASASDSWWYLLICGSLAVCAMILPGISGAFILVLLGAYEQITKAAEEFVFWKLGLVALGAIVGLLSFSKVLKWLFKHYENITLAVLTGFITGSLAKIWPWKKVLENKTLKDGSQKVINDTPVLPSSFDGEPRLWAAIGLILAGFLLIFGLEALANIKPKKNGTDQD
jgi:putative membrane protein